MSDRPQLAPSEKALRKIVEDILKVNERMNVWLTAAEAAEYLRMSANEFRRLVREEDIHEYRISERRVRYRREDLDGWMERR